MVYNYGVYQKRQLKVESTPEKITVEVLQLFDNEGIVRRLKRVELK